MWCGVGRRLLNIHTTGAVLDGVVAGAHDEVDRRAEGAGDAHRRVRATSLSVSDGVPKATFTKIAAMSIFRQGR